MFSAERCSYWLAIGSTSSLKPPHYIQCQVRLSIKTSPFIVLYVMDVRCFLLLQKYTVIVQFVNNNSIENLKFFVPTILRSDFFIVSSSFLLEYVGIVKVHIPMLLTGRSLDILVQLEPTMWRLSLQQRYISPFIYAYLYLDLIFCGIPWGIWVEYLISNFLDFETPQPSSHAPPRPP